MWWSLVALALGADEPKAPPWDVSAAHGPTHEVKLDLTEGTWMSVSVHGDQLVFDLLGDLWTMPLAGGEAKRLTEGAAWDVQPRFSPDGKRIAFASDRGGNEIIWVMNADGTDPRPLVDEKVARLTDPVWDPSGDWIVARRRTVDTRSIGVFELWQYHLEGGTGVQLTSKDSHPHAGEAVLDGKDVWFSSRAKRFDYNENPVGGLWSIVRLDPVSHRETPMVWGPGGGTRPMLSPDRRTLVFLSRDRTKTVLEAMDLETQTRRVLWDGLSADEMEGFAIHDTWPRMDWAPGGDLVLWSGGKLWRLNTQTAARTEIPFHLQGSWRLHDVVRTPRDYPDAVTAQVIRWPTLNKTGDLAFSAMGALWKRDQGGKVSRLSPGTGYAPTWSPDGKTLAWTSWDDDDGGRLHLTTGGRDQVLPVRGQLVNPTWSADGQTLVVLRTPGGNASPTLSDRRIYEIVVLRLQKGKWVPTVIGTLPFLEFSFRAPRLQIQGDRLFYLEGAQKPREAHQSRWVSVDLSGADRRVHLHIPQAALDAVASPDGRWLAYQSAHQLHLAPLPAWTGDTSPEAVGTHVVSRVVGDWVHWSPDGASLSWMEGNTRKTRTVADIRNKPPENSPRGFEGEVKTETVAVTAPRHRPTGLLALTHARVVTMNGDEVLEDVTVLVKDDRIVSVDKAAPPAGARVLDCTGKTIFPGMVDVHAHLHFSAGDVLPEQDWAYLTNLDFGVTTVHDPSASTDLVFTQAERVEAGYERGPRVFSTGAILYGALGAESAVTPDLEAARGHVRRMEAVGARSVKVYQQSRRDSRQWYTQVCRDEEVLCVPEGGGDLWQNLGMVVDGFHAIEHALSTVPLYADVRGLFAASPTPQTLGTFYTPTLLVSYSRVSGENWFFQHENPKDHPRLRRHYPNRALDARFWRTELMLDDTDWGFREVAREAARLQDQGLHVTLGAHGEVQGIGAHWELRSLGGPGAMAPLEALRAATLDGARYLGMDHLIGSVQPGKLADLVVVDGDPTKDLRDAEKIVWVVKNGEVVVE